MRLLSLGAVLQGYRRGILGELQVLWGLGFVGFGNSDSVDSLSLKSQSNYSFYAYHKYCPS